MAFITLAEAIAKSSSAGLDRKLAEVEIRKSASKPMETVFDVFLSHSYEDARAVTGIKMYIEDSGLSVYVDWIEDAHFDRSSVSIETAQMLRDRMNHCRMLMYTSSDASPRSKWMPWELGYFDGLKGGGIGIIPIAISADHTFQGQEYLQLYPMYELLNFTGIGRRFGRALGDNQGVRIETDVRSA